MATQPNTYVLSLTTDPAKHHLRVTFHDANEQLRALIAGRATFAGEHPQDPGYVFIDVTDESVLADLQTADFIENEGGSKIIGRDVQFHSNITLSPGLTD